MAPKENICRQDIYLLRAKFQGRTTAAGEHGGYFSQRTRPTVLTLGVVHLPVGDELAEVALGAVLGKDVEGKGDDHHQAT